MISKYQKINPLLSSPSPSFSFLSWQTPGMLCPTSPSPSFPLVTAARGLHGALPWEMEGWLVGVQGMLCSLGWGCSVETLGYRTDEKQCHGSVRSWEQVSDCISALPHPWCEIAREMPSCRAREEHCLLPEWFLSSVPGCESQEEPPLPCKARVLSWGHPFCMFAQGLMCS